MTLDAGGHARILWVYAFAAWAVLPVPHSKSGMSYGSKGTDDERELDHNGSIAA